MVQLPGGRFLMGTDDPQQFRADGEGPVRPVSLSSFWIDSTTVTNDQFASFVRASGYVTEAEQFGWSFVFWSHIDEARFAKLVEDTVRDAPWWCKVRGACWRAPEGPRSNVKTRSDHPVVHVSYNDAAAYAAWASKQLPTEAEWEYAARGGLVQTIFPWGNELEPDGKHRCNVWQGLFPVRDSGEDGYKNTSPVRAFPANQFELHSMVGNVWEWTADWFGTTHTVEETTDPTGPASGSGKVMKGGSFLCHASYCNRYRVAARSQNTPDSSTSNIGFRCVRRLSQPLRRA
jgi:sulfatase modifying factor 1